MPSNLKETITINVCVVGLSGGESLKGVEGVGKSCLCSRFVAIKEDDYRRDHISNISMLDWHSCVVNRNHWLYWGSTCKKYDDSLDLCFNIIEQTEFINDESMQVFDEKDVQAYCKRCATLKLNSPLKTVYRRKEQFASHEYNYGKFPADGLNIDGFICVCDPTEVGRRDFKAQINEINQILSNLVKTKKPIVLVTTKNDKRNQFKQEYAKEFDDLLSKKEFSKVIYPYLIEISSNLNINVNTPFYVLAQLCFSKHLAKLSTPNMLRTSSLFIKYHEALEIHQKRVDHSKACLTRLLNDNVSSYKFKYEQFYSNEKRELDSLIEFFGIEFVQSSFTSYLNNLKLKFIQAQTKTYLTRLENLLNFVFYTNDAEKNFYLNNSWTKVMDNMKRNKNYSTFIIQTSCASSSPTSTELSSMYSTTSKTTSMIHSHRATQQSQSHAQPWYENELLDSNELSIPYEVFISNECREKFEAIVKKVKNTLEKNESKNQLMNLLEANADKGLIQPGKSYEEAQTLLMGRLFYESLDENERLCVYEQFQHSLLQKSERNFKELLLENCDFLIGIILKHSFENYHVDEILAKLRYDTRHQILDRLSDKRTTLVLKHIAFLSCNSKKSCDCGTVCLDSIMSNYLQLKYNNKLNESQLLRPLSFFRLKKYLNFVIYGPKDLNNHLLNELNSLCNKANEYTCLNQVYNLNFEVLNSDDVLDNLNLNFFVSGIFYTTSDNESLLSFKMNLENLNKINQIESIKVTVFNFTCKTITIDHLNKLNNYNNKISANKKDILNYCNDVQLNYIDKFDELILRDTLDDYIKMSNTNDIVLNSIDREQDDYMSYFLHLSSSILSGSTISLNILCCIMCENDQNLIDLITRPFFNQNFFYNAQLTENKNTILIEINNGYQKQLISIEFVSYHMAVQYLSKKKIYQYDGHILCYSVNRLASFAYAKCLAKHLNEQKREEERDDLSGIIGRLTKPLPTCCLVAVTNKRPSDLLNDNLSEKLIQNGNYLSDELNLKFLIATPEFLNQTFAYSSFIDSLKRKVQDSYLNEIKINLDSLKLQHEAEYTLTTNNINNNDNNNKNEIIITSPSLHDNLLMYDESDITPNTTTTKLRSLSTDVFLTSHKIKASSSSSNIIFNYESLLPTQYEQQQQQQLSRIKREDSKNKLNLSSLDSCGASTSSLSSSNRLNSTPSPSYIQKDRSPASTNSPKTNASPSLQFSTFKNTIYPMSSPQDEQTSRASGPVAAPLAKAESVEIVESAKKTATAAQNIQKLFIPTIVHENDERIYNLDKLAKAQKEASPRLVKQSLEAEDLNAKSQMSRKQSKSKIRKKDLNKSFDDMPSQTVSCIDYASLPQTNDLLTSKNDYDESTSKSKSSRNFINKVSERLGVTKSKQSKKSSSNLNGCSTSNNSDAQFLSLDLLDSNQRHSSLMNSSQHSTRSKATTPVGGMFSTGSSNGSATSSNNERCIENDTLSNMNVPFIVEKCLDYIEEFGIDSEGIYRVSGHKQYVDSLLDDLTIRPETIDLKTYNPSQINVNIVATVIKEYFRHLKEPIIGSNIQEYVDLSKIYFNPTNTSSDRKSQINIQAPTQVINTTLGSKKISSSSNFKISLPIPQQTTSSTLTPDQSKLKSPSNSQLDSQKHELIDLLKLKFKKLNQVKYLTLQRIFLHLNKIASNSNKNNMDSNNLAICWWPTLLRPKFEDLNETEILTKTLQPLIRFIIDNAFSIFMRE